MIEDLKKELISLRLKGMSENLQFRLHQAASQHMNCTDFLAALIEDEQVKRNRKSFEKRLKLSGLKAAKTLQNYLFELQPSINKDLIERLTTCDFIQAKDKVIFMGISGIGKSHLVNGLGIRALEKGHLVYRFNANELVDELLIARNQRTTHTFYKKILKADFVILDEFAMRPFPEGGTDELFALLEKLDETMSVAITTNRDFKDWKPFFSDHTIASAFTDRAVNNAILVKVETGVSERQKTFERKNRPDPIQ